MKLFLLTLCSWFLFLWFSNAQNLPEQSWYNINSDFESNSWEYFIKNTSYDPNLDYGYDYIPSYTIYIFRFLVIILLFLLYMLIRIYKWKTKTEKKF